MIETKDEAKGTSELAPSPELKSMDAYGNLPRGLTTEELSQTGTQKLILNDLSKAESKIRELEPFRENYFDALVAKSILEEKLKKTKGAEILYSFCITAGGIIIGLAKILYESDKTLGVIVVGIGFSLVIGGILFKMYYRR